MRPKVVILTMLLAFGMLGIIVLYKGMQGKQAGESGVQTPGQVANAGSGSGAVTNAQGTPNLTNPVAVSDELRAALIAKQIDQIQELQGEIDGTNNPTIIQALLDKMVQPEPEVRSAALEAVKEINDTNAIPGLEKAVEAIQDPRGKVAVMDVIDYLKLPSAMPDVQPPETLTNATPTGYIAPDDKMNQHFLHKAKGNKTAQNSVSSVPAN